MRMLETRWQYPRTAFFAACVEDEAFIGIRPRMTCGPETTALLSAYPSVGFGDPGRRGRVWHMPRASFVPLVWELVGLNGWVRRLDLDPEFPDATPQDDPNLARWAETYANIGEIVLRRPYRMRDDWTPKREFPRRDPGAKQYQKPASTPRPPRPSRSREQIQAKVDEMLRDSRPVSARGLLPGQRDRTAQRDDYDRALLDLGFRLLAYSEEPMPMQPNGCIAHRVKPDGRLGEPRKLPASRRRMTPRERRAARQARRTAT
jgi:hypothetical protein